MAASYSKNSDYFLQDLSISNFEGTTLDIQNDFTTLEYYESVYENFNSGKLIIQDSSDLSQFFPLIGEEVITFSFSTDNGRTSPIINKKFRVYRTETNQDEEVLAHVLYFVSEEAFADQNINISKSYKKKSVADIVKNAFGFYFSDKKLLVEETVGLHHIVCPRWSPAQLINWTTSYAQNTQFPSGTYMFFENRDGFNYLQMEKMLSDDPIRTYTHALQNIEGDSKKNRLNDGFTAKSVRQLSGSSDTLKSLSEGMYANSYIAYDNISRTWKMFEYDYITQFDETQHLNLYKLCSNNFQFTSKDQRVGIIPTRANREESSYHKSNFGDPLCERYEETATYRTSVLSQVASRQFEIDFYGDSLLSAGFVVEVEMQNVSQLDQKTGQIHRFNRKNFLLTECTHKFNRKQYFVKARAVSDSLINEPKYLF